MIISTTIENSSLENAFMVVSPDFAFLDKTANRICDIDNEAISKYYGTYTEFLKKDSIARGLYSPIFGPAERDKKGRRVHSQKYCRPEIQNGKRTPKTA